MRFNVTGRFPSLNEYVEANRTSPKKGAAMKRSCTAKVRYQCKELPRPEGEPPWSLLVIWHEPNAKRDEDNVDFGVKFLLDGLVSAGVIPDDSRRFIQDIYHKVVVDKDSEPYCDVRLVPRDRVKVYIEEGSDG